jgi:hypothetical protein
VFAFLLLFLIVGLVFYFRSPSGKGAVGEWDVQRVLKRLDKDNYAAFHNLLLPTAEGKTSQIDHVIVSYYGVFVIETKNYGGQIYGHEKSAQWTQVFGKKKVNFYNPIWQNYGHVKTLQELFSDLPDVPFYSIVVFSNRAKLKVEAPSNLVVNVSNLLDAILQKRGPKLRDEQVLTLCDRLEEAALYGRKARKQHVRAIREMAAAKESKVAAGVCPKCGGQLVERKGNYGAFYGCSGYPECRFQVKQLET